MVSKTFDLSSQKEVLPLFKSCQSLAVKYLAEDMSNKIHLQYESINKSSNGITIDSEFLKALHVEPFNLYLAEYLNEAS